MSIFTALIPLIAMIGKWLIEKDLMGIEAKKSFLLWVKQSAKDGAISVKLHADYKELLKIHLDDEG